MNNKLLLIDKTDDREHKLLLGEICRRYRNECKYPETQDQQIARSNEFHCRNFKGSWSPLNGVSCLYITSFLSKTKP